MVFLSGSRDWGVVGGKQREIQRLECIWVILPGKVLHTKICSLLSGFKKRKSEWGRGEALLAVAIPGLLTHQ